MPVRVPRLPLLIGESPSAAGDRYHAFPLSGNPAKWVCRVAQIAVGPNPSIGDYYWAMQEHFDTANALERYPRDGFLRNKELAAKTVADLVVDYKVVVLLGRRAQRAYADGVDYQVGELPFYQWQIIPIRAVVAIPHPSGLNRVWNESGELEKARAVLKRAIELAHA